MAGPYRNWTYVNSDEPRHGEKLNRADALGNASYCNAEFLYAPDLNSRKWLEDVAGISAEVAVGGMPKIGCKQGRPAFVTFDHFSPYVIAGDPVDDNNPMTGKATDGLVVQGEAVGQVQVRVSTDGGQSWREVDDVSGTFRLDLTELVKGRYRWQVRFDMRDKAGLNAVSFETTCQMSQSMYPRLSPNESRIEYRSGQRGAAVVAPNFGLGEESLAEIEVASMRSPNLKYVGQKQVNDKAFVTTDNRPAHVVFRLESPENLQRVNAAAKVALRVPAPPTSDFRLEVSTDEGASWRLMSQADIPSDNDYSSAWMYGSTDVSAANVKSVLIRAHVYQGGYSTGLYNFEAYGVYQTSESQPVNVVYGWKEDGVAKKFRQDIPAGATSFEFTVPTGESIVDDFVTISAD